MMSIYLRRAACYLLLITSFVVIGLSVSTARAATRVSLDGRALSLHAIAEDSRWTRQILDPSTPVVTPIRAWATGTVADVSHPAGVVDGRSPSCLTGAGELVLDYGRETGGIVVAQITSAEPLTNLVVSYSETKQWLNPAGDYAPAAYSTTPRSDTVTPSGAPMTWTSSSVRGGERYVLLSLSSSSQNGGTPGRICVKSVKITIKNLRPAPAEYVGHFLSNDPQLNKAWYSGAYTYDLDAVQGCCGQYVVVDGAKRDRQLWAGDLSAAGPTGGVTTRAGLRAFKATLDAFSCYTYPDGYIADSTTPGSTCQGRPGPVEAQPGADYLVYGEFPVIGAYEALTVIAADEYWLASGDDAWVQQALPELRGAMSWMEAHLVNGLYEASPNEWKWTASFTYGADTFTNAVMVQALHGLSEMERRVGADSTSAASDENTAAQIAVAMRNQLYDPAAGAFVVDNADSNKDHTQDGNSAAVVANVAQGAQTARSLQYVKAHLWTRYGTETGELAGDSFMPQWISPFISGFELEARLQTGDALDALKLVRREWGRMTSGDPGGTVWETMGLDGNPPSSENSLAHGWSSGPTWLLSQYVLGCRPVTPGYKTWIVAPQPGDLRWAQGAVPTPTGALVSRWRVGAQQKSFTLTVKAPPQTTGAVMIPTLGRPRKIWKNGTLVWNGRRAVNRSTARGGVTGVTFIGIAGTDTFAWSTMNGRIVRRKSPAPTRRRRPLPRHQRESE